MEFLVPKESPLMLRMAILVFAVICGIYICSICLKQINDTNSTAFLNVQVSDRPCQKPKIEPADAPFVHFPKPYIYSRAECACNPVRYFAILSTQRSGSGWFETLLNSHTNISSNGEIFSVKVRRSNASTILETLDKLYNLDWVSSASKNECTAAVGLKWMLNQFDQDFKSAITSLPRRARGAMQQHEEVANYFKAKGVSVIFLFRRNLLRRTVSILANSYDREKKLLNGTHKSHTHSHQEAEILAQYKPDVDAKTLLPNLNQVKDMTTKALGYFNTTRHILLYYEDVLKNSSKLAEVQDFLKVPRMSLTSKQVKIHKSPLSEQVANWEEVKKTLEGTEYESFLYSDYRT